jgi:formylglycine-generating enzyme required for sulfatase activity
MEFFAMSYMSLQEAIVWCNARSLMEGKTPVYRLASDHDSVVKSKVGSDIAYFYVDPAANGYQIPTPAQWEYAARGGSISAAAWNYRWPGIDILADVPKYAWVDNIRLYDSYSNEIQVGLLLPNSAGIYDMGGNLHERTFRADSWDPSQFILRGGAFNRDSLRSAFDADREERSFTSSRDINGLRVISDVTY